MNQQLIAFIVQARIAKQWSVGDLAKIAECSPTELRGFEAGLISIRANLLHRLAEVLELDSQKLLEILGENSGRKTDDPTKVTLTVRLS